MDGLFTEPRAPFISSATEFTPAGFRWLRLKRLLVSDSAGRNYVWECVERATKHSESDGVGVIARVVSRVHATEQILLVVQWRAPFNKFVVELPAGLLDEGETIPQAAARELREETGYTGRILSTSTETTNDQGVCNSQINFAVAEIDADAPENQHPQPAHELGETIQPLLLPVNGLVDQLTRLRQERGWAIDSRLFAYALGLQQAAASTAREQQQ